MYRRIISAIALATLAMLAIPETAQANVDDFDFASWNQQIVLELDGEGRAIAHITETIVADFPPFDQNKGMVRGIPVSYEGAWIGPTNVNVTDNAGNPVPFALESDENFKVVLTGDERYVQGPQTYVITYSLRDIIHVPSDAQIDEFYWDLLPISRAQPIRSFVAEVRFSAALAEHLTGANACYLGAAGAHTDCALLGPEQGDDATVVFRTPPMALNGNTGVTVAFALDPATVLQPESRSESFFTDTMPMWIGAVSVGFAAAGGAFTARMRRKARSATGLIIAQYDVPDTLPPVLVPALVEGTKAAIPAEFIHLAVRGALRVEDGPNKKQPVLRLIDASKAPDPLDSRALIEIFGSDAPVGTALPLPKSDEKFSAKMTSLSAHARKQATVRGLLEPRRSLWAGRLSLIALGLALIAATVAGIAMASGRIHASAAFAVSIAALVLAVGLTIAQFVKRQTHTPTGAQVREYLLGVKEFIRVAEADRLQVLQSHSGAERTTIGDAEVVQIYERLLPYAILFGMEKEWAKALQLAYERDQSAPLWYPGFALGGGSFDQSISRFSQQASSSASYTSSSASGSSGGGFSGGGGGGGFAGGR